MVSTVREPPCYRKKNRDKLQRKIGSIAGLVRLSGGGGGRV
jgi:hypothetical protein